MRVVLITGSNLGDREKNIAEARRLLDGRAGRMAAASAVMESEPWGEMERGAGSFLNQVVVIDTELTPEQLLDATQRIERELGRESAAGIVDSGADRRYNSRTMDIDILFYGDRTIASPRLTIPHPMIARRGFVLRPLAQVAPEYVHPVLGLTAAQLLARLEEGEAQY